MRLLFLCRSLLVVLLQKLSQRRHPIDSPLAVRGLPINRNKFFFPGLLVVHSIGSVFLVTLSEAKVAINGRRHQKASVLVSGFKGALGKVVGKICLEGGTAQRADITAECISCKTPCSVGS